MREQNLDRFSNYQKVDLADKYYLSYMPLFRDLNYAVTTYAKGKLLDIGCGNKPYEGMFDGKIDSYFGCDVVQSSLNKVDLICEATDIPVADESFETVFSTQVIEHVADHQQMIREAHRLLRNDGYFIVSGPMYWHLHEEPFDFFRFTKHGFRYILERNGFEIVEVLANGGKWATFGQMVIHTFPQFLVKRSSFRKLNNYFFHRLDQKHYNDFNTMNYVIVARKRKNE
jgi:SAM-dependent methyltransferase